MKHATALVRLVLLLALLALAPRCRAGTTEQEVEEDQSLASRLVTPHRSWARGYAGGALRALFFVSPGGYNGDWFAPDTRLREVVELAQRVDLEADAIFFGGSKGDEFLGLDLGRRRAERLLAQPYQVYVFANASFEKLPPAFQFAIMEQVAKGAGLVCCGPAAAEFMTTERRLPAPVPWLMDGLPELDGKAPADILRAYRLGAGRGVCLDYDSWALTPRIEFSYAALADYDYRMLWVARCVLWAAGREGAVSVAFRARAEGGPAPSRPSWVVEIARAGAAVPSRLQVDINVRRRSDGLIMALDEESVSVGLERPEAVPAPVPHLRTGSYVIDAIVRSRRGVEAFAAMGFEVTSPFGVEAVTLTPSFAERGERLAGTVSLRGPLPAGARLQLRFRDSFDRVLEQREMLAPSTERATLPFEYRPGAHDTILMRCEAALWFEGREVEMKEVSFQVPERRRGQFNFLQWDTPTDVLAGYAWQQMRQAGMNLCLVSSFSEAKAIPALAANDIALVPYTTRILDPTGPDGAKVRAASGEMVPLCWNDAPAAAGYVRGIVANQAKHREHGVFCYSLGDEGVTQGCCVQPPCLEAYRGYLQEQYGTVERLNASWGATYASFAEVDLLDHKDNLENAAREKGLYARWYDRQAFARWNLMQFSGRFVNAFRELEPQAVTGFEGTGGFGDDFDTILGTNTFYSPYPGLGDDIIRAAAARTLIRANWMGYSKTADALSDAAWRMVMRNMDSVWYWMWTGVGSYRGYVTPTLDLYPATAELAAEMRPVRRGLGDLLLQAQPRHSGIAVFYSLPSALASGLDGGAGYVGAEAAHQTWTRLTSELGFDFRYLTQAMLRQGALRPEEFRVLLLPMAQALDDTDAAQIGAFAEAGGTVIADVRPGVFDGHCKPVSPGALDALFGIRRTGRAGPVVKPLDVRTQFGGTEVRLQTTATRLDPGIEAVGAQALGQVDGAPVFLRNQVGQGCAVLLNFQVLSDQVDEAHYAAVRRFVRGLYAGAAVVAQVATSDPAGEALPMTETRVWQTGDALVFGLWRQMQCAWFAPTAGTVAGTPQAARIALPEPRYVYDLRQGKYLGHTAEIDTSLRWGRANFFLAVPERLGAVELLLSPSNPVPGTSLQAEITVAGSGQSGARQAVYAEVIGPDGLPVAWGGRALVLVNGRGGLSVPVAHNAEPGRWRLRVTELFSNESAEATWRVR